MDICAILESPRFLEKGVELIQVQDLRILTCVDRGYHLGKQFEFGKAECNDCGSILYMYPKTLEELEHNERVKILPRWRYLVDI